MIYVFMFSSRRRHTRFKCDWSSDVCSSDLGFYFHREGPGLAFGGRERALEEVAEAAARRLPVLAELPIQTTWWGWYDVSRSEERRVGKECRFLWSPTHLKKTTINMSHPHIA